MAEKSKSDAKAESKKQAKAKAKGKRLWKMLGTGTGLLAGLATTRALDATWRTATGHKPPNKPENPDIAGREALLWAAVSGMALGLARTYSTRRLAHYWVRSTGELPPGMAEEATKAETKRLKQQAREKAS